MNSAAVCTEKVLSKGNPLSMLKGVGGRIADSLKTVAKNNAAMFAGLSMLTAASSGTALATEVVLRDTIRDTPATTQDARWLRGSQTTVPAVPTVATFAVQIPSNSVCKLSTISFVFGSMSSMPAIDVFDWREIFNSREGTRTTDLRLEVFDGPSTNLVNRLTGDIYSRSISQEEMRTTIPWGGTSYSYSGDESSPYNKATLNFTEIKEIVTGAEGKTIYVKVCFVKLQNKSTFGCLALATGEPAGEDIALGSGQTLGTPTSALAVKVTADIQPQVVVQPVPACGLEPYKGKLAVCWPASYGTNYVVQMVGSLSQTTQLGFMWEDLAVTPALSATDAKYCVDIPTNSPTALFRLRSR
jgi:hypothetical protein